MEHKVKIGISDGGLLISKKSPVYLSQQRSLLPVETWSQFAEPVIPDEAA
jgi:hypothetical protein